MNIDPPETQQQVRQTAPLETNKKQSKESVVSKNESLLSVEEIKEDEDKSDNMSDLLSGGGSDDDDDEDEDEEEEEKPEKKEALKT